MRREMGPQVVKVHVSLWGVVEVLGAMTAQRKEPFCTMTTIMSSKAKDVDLESNAVQWKFLQ